MPAGQPVSQLVNVQTTITTLPAQAPAINQALYVGTSDVIDVVQRMRPYPSLAAVAADFGTTAEEYLAATLWFAQRPQPTNLFIGRWAKLATNGRLIGAFVSAANQLISNWTAITSGAFMAIVDSIPISVTGLNFSAQTNLNGVASTIQTALQAAAPVGTGGATATVAWDANYQLFRFKSGSTGTSSTFNFLFAPTATGNIAFSGNPSASDTITLNGTVITFVSGTPSGNQVQIGAAAGATIISLIAFLRASSDTQIVKFANFFSSAIAASTSGTVYLSAATAGTGGNALTLAKSSTVINVSGATLSGGTGTDVSGASYLNGNSTDSGAYVAAGIAAETALTAVTTLDQMFSTTWYAAIVGAAADTDHQAIAAYIEAANPPHFYGVTTQEGGVLVSGDTGDIAAELKASGYNKSAVIYSSSSLYVVMSLLARILTTAWLGANTTITLMYKQLPGVTPETLTVPQALAISAKNCNVFITYQNNTQLVQYGTCASGQFIDTIIGADWLAGQIQTGVFNVLYTTPTKIPQTDAGVGVLVNAIEAACVQGVTNGLLAGGLPWNATGFGALNQGDILSKGFYVYAPPEALQSPTARAARQSPIIQVAAKLAGAIHTVSVLLFINP